MMGVLRWKLRASNCRSASRRSATPLLVSNKKKPSPALKHLQQILAKALQRTAALWPPIKDAYALVYQAAHILANHEQQTGAQVRETYQAWVKTMQEQKANLGTLSTTIDHFVEKTANFAAFALSLL